MAYKKSAKDLAWDRERLKYQKQIRDWQSLCKEYQATVEAYEIEINRLLKKIKSLENVIEETKHMSAEELLQHHERVQKTTDMLNNLISMKGMLDIYD